MGGSIHPAILGLLQLLPDAPSPGWAGRDDWLAAFERVIGLLYPDAPERPRAPSPVGEGDP